MYKLFSQTILKSLWK